MFPTRDSSNNLVKYSGRSRATVLDNRDPLARGRIIVDHPLLGSTTWIPYLRSPGSFDVPPIGSVVYVEADAGIYTHPVAWGNVTIGTDSDPNIPEAFQEDIPTNRGLFTPGGHLIELDDGIATFTSAPDDTQLTTEDRGIRITTRGGNKIELMEDTINSKQFILLQDIGGNIVKLDYKNNELTIHSIGKATISTTTNHTETVGGNKTETISGNLTLNVSGNVNINVTGNATIQAGGNIVEQATQIHLNGTSSGITTENSHQGVIDLITGVPVMPSPTTFGDV